jgi:hypothetical protein
MCPHALLWSGSAGWSLPAPDIQSSVVVFAADYNLSMLVRVTQCCGMKRVPPKSSH